MVYDVLVKRQRDSFTATVLNLPDCSAEAPTRDEAIERARAAASQMVSEADIVQIELGAPRPKQPFQGFAGMWRSDETFDDFKTAMADYRRQVDADATVP